MSNFPGPWIFFDENKTLPDFDDRGGNVLENIWAREEEIIDIISILDSNKATGPDKISNKIIISINNYLTLFKVDKEIMFRGFISVSCF
jgi:hypothetical protein